MAELQTLLDRFRTEYNTTRPQVVATPSHPRSALRQTAQGPARTNQGRRKGTHVILLIQALDVRVVNATTGEPLGKLTSDSDRDFQPRTHK